MAKSEQDREDLLREATALTQRAELEVEGYEATIVIGFRDNGSISIYLGANPVYQFNSLNQLRRAYVDGLPIKAENGRLVSLRRERTNDQTQMIRREFNQKETDHLLADVRQHADRLFSALSQGRFQIVGQVPEHSDVVGKIRDWLASLKGQITIAPSPHVR